MSDKKLLNENTIRRFMTLAKVDRLTDNFINEKKRQEELEEASYMEEDEEFEEGMGYSMEEDEMLDEQEEEDVELDLGDDEGDEEAGMTDPDDPMSVPADEEEEELGEADVSLTEEEADLLISLGERLKEAMEKEEEEGAGMTDPDAPMSVPADEEGEEGEEDEELADMEPEEDEDEEEEIVQEILKRVTSRLVREKRIRR
tara:strand:- start:2470 stop:3072 length:603 start_codon:yes stop_codon:yes gene_type:complete